MFIKTNTIFRDLVENRFRVKGDIFEVTEERAKELEKAGVSFEVMDVSEKKKRTKKKTD